MTSPRAAALPFNHLLAEMAALPLASRSALELVVTRLDPALRHSHTCALWRAAERVLLTSFPGVSVDEVVAVRDRLWFRSTTPSLPAEPSGVVPLHRYLGDLAGQFLQSNGNAITPALPHDLGFDSLSGRRADGIDARQMWRWLSFALPPDLLIGACDTPAVSVNLLSPTLEHQLRSGLAETHLHVGAAIEFPVLWVGLLHALPFLKKDAFSSPGAEFDDGNDLGPWLVRAALARQVLAHYLATRTGTGTNSLADYLDRLRRSYHSDSLTLRRALADLAEGTLSTSGPSHAQLALVYAEYSQVTIRRMPDTLNEVYVADPIADLLPWRGTTPEITLVRAALDYLQSSAGDALFAALFWQTVRIRALLYRHIVQRPMTPGLQWFIRHYDRISPSRRRFSKKLLVESAARLGGLGHGLRSLEARTSPERTWSEIAKFVKEVRAAWRGLVQPEAVSPASGLAEPPVEVGIVFHFAKDRGGGARRGLHSAHGRFDYGNPMTDKWGYRYGAFYREKRAEALALGGLLRNSPAALHIVRGVDVCTDELGIPNWVLVPLFRYVHRMAAAGARVVRASTGIELPAMRTSAHAGEDFVHLLGGLRRVHESLIHFDMHDGDRIGHGLALGIDARKWARDKMRVPVSRWERMLDLVWEWNCYASGRASPPDGRLAMIEREVRTVTSEVFRGSLSPFDASTLMVRLYDEDWLRDAGFPNGPPPSILSLRFGSRESLEKHYIEILTSPALYARGQEILWIDVEREGEALARLQSAVREEIGRRGVTIEINPSSNLLVGNLADLANHPLWRMRSPNGGGDAPPLTLCIGSDDPVVFATNLREEYQLLADTMRKAGLSDDQAREWLEHARRSGLDARFTLPWSLDLSNMWSNMLTEAEWQRLPP